jgi:methylmalonyl-CoA/ethylmalonyl-CoA epimerase
LSLVALREVSLASPSLEVAASGISAITGHPGYELQEQPSPPIQSAFRSFAVGDRSIALMCGLGDGNAIDRFLARRGPGIFSMTFEVEDVEQAAVHLRANGARLVLDDPITLDGRSGSETFEGIRINFVSPQGPTHGLVFELQQLSGARQARLPDEPTGPDIPFALNEVHCAVHSVDDAAADLERLFGFDVGPEVVQAQAPEEVRYRNLSIGGRPALALIEPASETSTVRRFLDRRGEGIFSVSMRVGDVRAYASRVHGNGVEILFDEPKEVHEARIGADRIGHAQINWVKPTPASSRVLFEVQEYAGP